MESDVFIEIIQAQSTLVLVTLARQCFGPEWILLGLNWVNEGKIICKGISLGLSQNLTSAVLQNLAWFRPDFLNLRPF